MNNEINTILREFNIKNYKITRMKNGLANKVYKIENNKKKYVLKKYVQIKNNKLSKTIQEYCLNVNIPIPKIIKDKTLEDKQIILLEYVCGRHIFKLKEANIKEIINIILQFQKIVLKDQGFNSNLLEKTKEFYNYLKEKERPKVKQKYINTILHIYEEKIQKTKFENLILAHGDLSPTNIIWVKNKIKCIIDFDEAILAPKDYDFIVTIIKFCIKKSDINITLAKKIIKTYKQNNTDFSIKNIESTLYLYILKVIMEKLYLYEENIIDICDKRQMKDDWNNWYKILINKDLIKIFFE